MLLSTLFCFYVPKVLQTRCVRFNHNLSADLSASFALSALPPLLIPPSPCAPAVIQGGADPGEGGHEAHQRSCPPAGHLRCPFVDGERPRPGAPQQQMESASGRVHCWVCALALTLSAASLSSGQSR